MKTGRGWSGLWEDGRVCNWAEPFKSSAEVSFLGSGSKTVRVRILKESDYRTLVKNQKEQAK